jgi:hypothetical protein
MQAKGNDPLKSQVVQLEFEDEHNEHPAKLFTKYPLTQSVQVLASEHISQLAGQLEQTFTLRNLPKIQASH